MSNLIRMHKLHIKDTDKKALVRDAVVVVCNITNTVNEELKFPTNRVYVTTRTLKHVYDKRAAQEYDFLLNNLQKIIKTPTKIYANKEGKTGSFCFSKEMQGSVYFCIIESNKDVNPNDGEKGMNYVVSAYRLSGNDTKRERYLASYKLLWSWKDDTPSS